MKKCFLLVAALLLLLPGCGSAGQINLNEYNNGELIYLQAGQTVELILASNMSTGYSWQYTAQPDASILEEIKNDYRQEIQFPGAPGEQFWVFKGTGPGTTTLVLGYQRPWEKETAPLKTYSLEFKVVPQVKILLNQNALDFDVPPVIGDNVNMPMVPLRAVFEALGAQVTWLGETQQVKAVRGDRVLLITVGSNVAYKDGTAVYLEAAPKIYGSRVLLPMAFISEAFDCRVNWDGPSRVVSITN